ncbi:MAG: hypothetical protein WCP06_01330 [Verrucomicrobiota bacterium]
MTQFLLKFTLILLALLLIRGEAKASACTFTADWNLAGTKVTLTNGAIFQDFNFGSGSGTYTDLYRIDTNTALESGYNYDGTGTPPFDQKNGVGIIHADLADLPVITIKDAVTLVETQYVQVTIDLNQNQSGANQIKLLDFRVYVNSDPNNTNTPVYVNNAANLSQLGRLAYGMSLSGTDTNQIIMTPKSGSGTTDFQIDIPLSYFRWPGINNTDNLYFWMSYDQNNGGYEELGYYKGATATYGSVVPEAQTVWGGVSIGVLLLGGFLRRRFGAKENAFDAAGSS